MADISSFITPNNTEYFFKDAAAREAIAALNGREWYVVTNAADTPYGVKWDKDGTEITGTLVASADTKARIYFVPHVSETGKDIYEEWVTVSPTASVYIWERFGTTDINISDLGALAYKDSASGSYTPSGSVSAPTISVSSAGSTATIHNPTAKTMVKQLEAAAPGATAPSNSMTYYAVEGEKLKLYQLGYSTEDSITTSDTTVKTSDATYTATAPSFTGTAATITVS